MSKWYKFLGYSNEKISEIKIQENKNFLKVLIKKKEINTDPMVYLSKIQINKNSDLVYHHMCY